MIRFLKSKKGQLELLQTQEWETHVGNCLKKLDILPLYSQYIFSISIFVTKKQTFIPHEWSDPQCTQDSKPTCIHPQLIDTVPKGGVLLSYKNF